MCDINFLQSSADVHKADYKWKQLCLTPHKVPVEFNHVGVVIFDDFCLNKLLFAGGYRLKKIWAPCFKHHVKMFVILYLTIYWLSVIFVYWRHKVEVFLKSKRDSPIGLIFQKGVESLND